MDEETKTGIEIKVGFFPHAFFLFAPKIDIDGQTHKKGWGTHFFPLAPGRHAIKIHFMYLFMPSCFERFVDLVVEEGKTSKVKYWMPLFAKGSLRVQ